MYRGQKTATTHSENADLSQPNPQPSPIDVDKLLRFFRQVYVHALTLQEMIVHTDLEMSSSDYVSVRERMCPIVNEQFEIFFAALHDPVAFQKAVDEFLSLQTIKTRVQ
jgi:hypothetical protein